MSALFRLLHSDSEDKNASLKHLRKIHASSKYRGSYADAQLLRSLDGRKTREENYASLLASVVLEGARDKAKCSMTGFQFSCLPNDWFVMRKSETSYIVEGLRWLMSGSPLIPASLQPFRLRNVSRCEMDPNCIGYYKLGHGWQTRAILDCSDWERKVNASKLAQALYCECNSFDDEDSSASLTVKLQKSLGLPIFPSLVENPILRVNDQWLGLFRSILSAPLSHTHKIIFWNAPMNFDSSNPFSSTLSFKLTKVDSTDANINYFSVEAIHHSFSVDLLVQGYSIVRLVPLVLHLVLKALNETSSQNRYSPGPITYLWEDVFILRQQSPLFVHWIRNTFAKRDMSKIEFDIKFSTLALKTSDNDAENALRYFLKTLLLKNFAIFCRCEEEGAEPRVGVVYPPTAKEYNQVFPLEPLDDHVPRITESQRFYCDYATKDTPFNVIKKIQFNSHDY